MNLTWIYHYSAIYQNSPGGIHYIDGIATHTGKIENYEHYQELKTMIAKGDGCEDVDPAKLTILSLTLIHGPEKLNTL